MCDTYPQFTQALQGLGKNDEERGAALGVNAITIRRYRKKLPKVLRPFTKRTTVHLLRALADAVELDACPTCV